MSSFISKSLCHGNRPRHLLSIRYYSRPRLVSRLLNERNVARFIIAPPGYGKTSLALEYAESMFMMSRVCWVNCESPCFIRDLDAKDLVCSTMKDHSIVKLVVFEDLPFLDDARAQAMSTEIDRLMEKGIEVLLTCTPSYDTLARLQRDRVAVGAFDLLLDADEVASTLEAIPSWIKKRVQATPSCRVPALAWGQATTSARDFLYRSFHDAVPSDVLLAFVCTAALGSGTYDGLAAFGRIDVKLVEQSAKDYPHLGYSEDQGIFEAPPFEAGDIAYTLRGVVDAVVKASSFDTREGLATALANTALSAGRPGRACDIMAALCPSKVRAPWIIENAYGIVEAHCFLPLLHLVESIRSTRIAACDRWSLAVVEAVCLHVLGDGDEACKCAKRCAFERQAPGYLRILAALILVGDGSSTMNERASEALELLFERAGAAASLSGRSRYVFLAESRLAIAAGGAAQLARLWLEAQGEGCDEDMLAIAAAWYYDILAAHVAESGDADPSARGEGDRAIEEFVRELLTTASAQTTGYFSASSGIALEMASVKGLRLHGGPLPSTTMAALRDIEMDVMRQRESYRAEIAQKAIMRDEWLSTHPDDALGTRAMSAAPAARLRVPQLSIKVFGTLEVHIGEHAVDPECLRGRHVRALIALLAAKQGREVPRDAICQAMWPNSTLNSSKKNFYSVWSRLRHTLSLPDGSCPYLIRHRSGCSFDQAYVQSDIARLDVICRTILFEEPEFEHWSDLLGEIDRDFTAELLPSENSNQLIMRIREEYRTRLIDALLVASNYMLVDGNDRRAVWCAQMAIDQDDTREDAYMALMRAQVAAGQRTAAMATFQDCRRILSEKLGIDPSPEMMRLYQQLLDSASN